MAEYNGGILLCTVMYKALAPQIKSAVKYIRYQMSMKQWTSDASLDE